MCAVAGWMSGGPMSTSWPVVRCIARIYEVDISKVDADIRKLLTDDKFVQEAKMGC